MRKWIVVALMISILSGLCVCVFAESITDLQQESNQITEELNEVNNRLQAVQGELSENMQQLQNLDNQIAQSEEELNKIDIQVDTLMAQIAENEDKLAKTQQQYDEMQQTVDERLITIYETPKLEFLGILLNAQSVTDFLGKYHAIEEMTEYDLDLIETVKNQKRDIETTKKILEEKKKQIVEDKQTQQKKAQVLANTKTMREYYISKLTAQERELQNKIDEYNAQVAEIEAEIRLLALNSISEDYLGGALLWPVPGHTRLTSLYGMRVHPITGAYNLHTGIDHGGGVQTLYAHGSEILVQLGQTVSAGTEVLKVGSTGYSTGPHAHFEIRINGQTVNPLDYLLDLNKLQEEQTNKEETNQEEVNTN